MADQEKKPHHHPLYDTEGLTRRLSRIEGHVRAVSRMVAEDQNFTDVMIQLAAIRSALAQVGHIVLENHVNCCVIEAASNGDANDAVKEFKKALDIWMKS